MQKQCRSDTFCTWPARTSPLMMPAIHDSAFVKTGEASGLRFLCDNLFSDYRYFEQQEPAGSLHACEVVVHGLAADTSQCSQGLLGTDLSARSCTAGHSHCRADSAQLNPSHTQSLCVGVQGDLCHQRTPSFLDIRNPLFCDVRINPT